MDEFARLVSSPIRFRLYLLMKIPSAFFSGLRIKSADGTQCAVTVPYKWFTQNPFRSTYFACLAMAAEMSTGILAMAHVYKKEPKISMLVVGMESTFHKKATGRTTFTCTDGQKIKTAIGTATTTGTAQTVRALTTGANSDGELIAEFYITWSFKVRDRK